MGCEFETGLAVRVYLTERELELIIRSLRNEVNRESYHLPIREIEELDQLGGILQCDLDKLKQASIA